MRGQSDVVAYKFFLFLHDQQIEVNQNPFSTFSYFESGKITDTLISAVNPEPSKYNTRMLTSVVVIKPLLLGEVDITHIAAKI